MPFYKHRSATAILAAFLWLMTASAPAHAACSSPAREAASIIYNADNKLIQYCDGTNWIAAGFPGSGSGGCTNPTGVEGAIIYNADIAVMQFCGGAVWVPMAYQASALAKDIVGWWKLDESSGTSAADSSGNSHTGTLTNFPASPWTTGQINGALTFDGVDDDIAVADESAFDFDRTNPFSLSVWLNYNSSAAGFDYIFAKVLNGTNFPGFQLELDATNRKLHALFCGVAAGCSGGDRLEVRTAANSIQPSAWHHVVMTYDGSSAAAGVHLYIDGADMAVTVVADGLVSSMLNNTMLRIGSNPAAAGARFDGKLDDARVYSRVLSASEVTALAAQNTNKKLVAHWTFDETSGTSAADSSGNGNTGTLTNMAGTEWTAGKIGNALTFDGVNDYVTTSSSQSFGSEMTLSGWFKTSVPVSGEFLSWRHMRFCYMGSLASGKVGCTVDGDSTGGTMSTTTLADNAWHHLAYTVIGNTQSLYIDGIVSSTATETLDTTSATIVAGHRDFGGYYQGSLDDVRVYNYALSASEIAQLAGVGADTTSNLVAHYKLDETSGTSASDSAGTNTGTLTNFPASPWTAGQVEGALDFDGTDDYIAASSITSPSAGTLAWWMKADSVGGTIRRITGSHDNFEALIDSTGKITGDICGNTTLQTPSALTMATWYHVALTWDDVADSAKIYLNGTLNYSGTPAMTCGQAGNLNIGFRPGASAGQYFDGILDDLRIYNRVLSPLDIAVLADSFPGDCSYPKGYKGKMIFNADKTMMQYCAGNDWIPVGKAAGSITDGLVAYWKFDETSGTSAADSSGNNNTGTLTNGPTWQPTGKVGGALNFDGTDDRVNLPTDLIDLGTVTVCAWVYPTILNDGFHTIIGNGRFQFGAKNTNSAAMVISDSTTGQGLFANNVLTLNAWQHVCTVRNSGTNGTASLFVNSVFVGSGSSNTPVTGFGLAIGAHGQTTDYPWKGLIDDVRLYNRALNPGEIRSLYNATK